MIGGIGGIGRIGASGDGHAAERIELGADLAIVVKFRVR